MRIKRGKKTAVLRVCMGEGSAPDPSTTRFWVPYLSLIHRTLLIGLVTIGLVACGVVSSDGPVQAANPNSVAGAEAETVGQAPTVDAPVSTPAPTPTPAPILTRLTEPGCCTGPTWSADGTQVRYVDRPPAQPVGLYAVGLDGGPPTLVRERLGVFSPDDQYIAYPESGETYVEVVATGERWVIDNGGRRVTFSPGGTRLLWTQARGASGFDTRPIDYHVLSVRGDPVVEPVTLYGGGFSGWLDEDHLLVTGRPEPDQERALYSMDVRDGSLVELARGERVRSGIPSPGGAWVAYLVMFDRAQPERDGFWIVSADGQTSFKLDLFGPIQWRGGNNLLIVPQEMGAPSHRIIQIDARTGEAHALTDPATTPFKIEGGDWRVSPDGQHVVFVSAEDRAIWLLRLPPA